MFSWKRLQKNEQGQAALETAIILIAFVVVAAVFAFTILSAGNASTEKGKKAIASGLENVQGTMSVKGSVMAQSSTDGKTVKQVVFTVALVAGGSPIDLSACPVTVNGTPSAATPPPGAGSLVIAYRDNTNLFNSMPCTTQFIGSNNGDTMLDANELAEITVDFTKGTTTPALAASSQFTLELKPPTGSVIDVTRSTPAVLKPVMDLN